MIQSIKPVFWTSLFFIPGFIIVALKRAVHPNRRINSLDNFGVCFGYSLFVIVCLYAAFPDAYNEYLEKNSFDLWIHLFLLELIATFFVGILVLIWGRFNLTYKILSFVKLNPSTSFPTAWDEVFDDRKNCFVVVHLISGEKIYGYFNQKARASTHEETCDLYLDHICDYDPTTQQWSKSKTISSTYIGKNQIKKIDFIELEDLNHD